MKKINIIFYFNNYTKWVADTISCFLNANPEIFHFFIFSSTTSDDLLNILIACKKSNFTLYRGPYTPNFYNLISLINDNLKDGYVYIVQNTSIMKLQNNLDILEKNLPNYKGNVTFISSQEKFLLNNECDNKDIVNICINFNNFSISNLVFDADYFKSISTLFNKYMFASFLKILLINKNNINYIKEPEFKSVYQMPSNIDSFFDEFTIINDLLIDEFYDKHNILSLFLAIRYESVYSRVFSELFSRLDYENRQKLFKFKQKNGIAKLSRLYPNYNKNNLYNEYITIKNERNK